MAEAGYLKFPGVQMMRAPGRITRPDVGERMLSVPMDVDPRSSTVVGCILQSISFTSLSDVSTVKRM